MIAKEKIFDDLAKVAGGTVGLLSDAKRQIHDDVKSRVDELALRLNLVPREDFEALEEMVKDLRARIETLEGNKKTTKKKKA